MYEKTSRVSGSLHMALKFGKCSWQILNASKNCTPHNSWGFLKILTSYIPNDENATAVKFQKAPG